MLGSFGEAEAVARKASTLRRANDACLRLLEGHHRHRHLPQAGHGHALDEHDEADWITPAPDERLFDGAAEAQEKRESVELHFIALLQHLPPKQRSIVLLRDIAGWPASRVAAAVRLKSIGSALSRARRALASADEPSPHEEPPAAALRAWLRSAKTPGVRVELTRANGCPALSFHRRGETRPHELRVVRFQGGKAVEAVSFTGRLRGF
jgi:DNA-directed RNA polymerase specialized sigma24 family protein